MEGWNILDNKGVLADAGQIIVPGEIIMQEGKIPARQRVRSRFRSRRMKRQSITPQPCRPGRIPSKFAR
jgi:hypothetical protein